RNDQDRSCTRFIDDAQPHGSRTSDAPHVADVLLNSCLLLKGRILLCAPKPWHRADGLGMRRAGSSLYFQCAYVGPAGGEGHDSREMSVLSPKNLSSHHLKGGRSGGLCRKGGALLRPSAATRSPGRSRIRRSFLSA